MKLVIEIDKARFKDIQRIVEVQHEMSHFQTAEQIIAKGVPIGQEPKMGHWIRVTDKAGHLVWECDKCGWQQGFNTNFCPDCGAKMIEPQESEVRNDQTRSDKYQRRDIEKRRVYTYL